MAIGRTFSDMKSRRNYDAGMGIYLTNAQKVPIMRVLYVDYFVSRSYIDGQNYLNYVKSRLIAVEPEAQGASIGFVDT